MSRFTLASKKIIYDIIDNEVMILNLEDGNYFSLDGVAAFLWPLVISGLEANEILAECKTRYVGDNDSMLAAIENFISELEEKQFIKSSSSIKPKHTESAYLEGEKIIFSDPVINMYSDMQDLLLLDPIHDVDETGWPQPKTEGRR